MGRTGLLDTLENKGLAALNLVYISLKQPNGVAGELSGLMCPHRPAKEIK